MSQPRWAWPHSRRMCPLCPHCSGSRLLHREPSEPALGCMHLRGLSCSVLRGTDLVGPAFFDLPRSKKLTWPGVGEFGHCELLLPPSLLLGFLGVQPAHLLRRRLTVQNAKKSWLAMKPSFSLVDNASLGPRLPPSGSGCLSPEGDGLPPASSVQSFVVWVGLRVS